MSKKETMEVIIFFEVLESAIRSARADGKIDFTDLPTIMPLLAVGQAALGDIQLSLAEVKNMNSEELQETITRLVSAFVGIFSALIAK